VSEKQLTAAEVVELGAVDSQFFCSYFFPRTARQDPPAFHTKIWDMMESKHRLINIQVFRGGAKTSICRLYTAKRIAYGLAHTILYLGRAESHAIRSVNWLRTQVEHNRRYSQIFGLRPGDKWQDVEAQIWHGADEYPIWIMGMGITGTVRGINRDDFRPDLIVCDDILDNENCATEDQREKVSELLYGAIMRSLAPASEAPDAKLVMLNTPLHKEDVSTLALKDEEWRSAVHGCWTSETQESPLQQQESSWPERYPSVVLRKEKSAAAARNKLSGFIREMECRLVSPETSDFKEEWLRFYDIEPEGLRTVMVIDPVPPPSEKQIAAGFKGKDYEALAVVGRRGQDYYLLEYSLNRGHNPSWTIAEFFRLGIRWNPFRIYVESTAYQRTLAWLLKEAMEQQRRWFVIEEFDDRRSKRDKIIDGLSGPAAAGHIYIRKSHTDFISQFRDYPAIANDDLIEAMALGVKALQGAGYDSEAEAHMREEEDDIPALEYARGAP